MHRSTLLLWTNYCSLVRLIGFRHSFSLRSNRPLALGVRIDSLGRPDKTLICSSGILPDCWWSHCFNLALVIQRLQTCNSERMLACLLIKHYNVGRKIIAEKRCIGDVSISFVGHSDRCGWIMRQHWCAKRLLRLVHSCIEHWLRCRLIELR